MSGFAAIRGVVNDELIQGLCAAAPYRGDPRIWRDDGVALIGFEGRRGAPLSVSDDLAVAADARIDNRADVARALGPDAPPPGASDAEVLGRVWRRWGPDGLQKVIGDFAGAIWDRRTRRLHVFRDPLGVKPALLARSRGRVLAASDIPMLLADPGVDRTPDDAWVAAFLVAGSGFARAAGYSDVERLVPGVVATAADDRTWAERPWWTWKRRTVRERDARAYAEHLGELLDTSVRARIAGVRRAGVALSGGMDSTSVAASLRAAAASDQMLAAVSIGFETPEGDERELQRAVAARLGLALRWAELGTGPFDSDPVRTIERFGVPPVSPNWFQPDAVARAAAADGIEVILDGIDGDSLLQGSLEVFSDLLVTGRWRAWLREATALRATLGVPRKATLKFYSLKPLVPPPVLASLRRLRRRSSVPEYVDPGLAERCGLERMLTRERWRPGRAYASGEMGAVSPAVLPMTMELLDSIYTQAGVEVAHPFLDRRVVEFCLGLPWRQKLSGGRTKAVLRSAMRDRLPAEVTERPAKADLSAPFDKAAIGKEKALFEEGLRLAASNGTRWCARGGLGRLGERFAEGDLRFDAYRVAFLGYWLRWNESAETEPRRKGMRSSAYH